MFNEIKITKIEAVHECTEIQVDILNKESKEENRLFIKTSEIFKTINNKLYEEQLKYNEKCGWRHIDEVKINKKDLIK